MNNSCSSFNFYWDSSQLQCKPKISALWDKINVLRMGVIDVPRKKRQRGFISDLPKKIPEKLLLNRVCRRSTSQKRHRGLLVTPSRNISSQELLVIIGQEYHPEWTCIWNSCGISEGHATWLQDYKITRIDTYV